MCAGFLQFSHVTVSVMNLKMSSCTFLSYIYIYMCVCVCVCVHTYYIYVYVYMYVLEENKLNEIKVYRQHLRDFMNKLMNDEIVCDIFDDEFEKKKFPS